MPVYLKKLVVDDQEFEVIDETARDGALYAQQLVTSETQSRIDADSAINSNISDLSDTVSDIRTNLTDVEAEVARHDHMLAVHDQNLTLSNIAGISDGSSCHVYTSAQLMVLAFNINGAIVSSSEVTIATIPEIYRPRQNYFKICQTQSGNKYILSIRINGNLGIQMIDVPDSYAAMWFRETICYM